MALFKKNNTDEKLQSTCFSTTAAIATPFSIKPELISAENEEWIWVEGYKGTDANMCCKGYQYELNKEHNFEGKISICDAGFHFCRSLKGVFQFYGIGNGNRFFKVRALVKKDITEPMSPSYIGYSHWLSPTAADKLVAKTIIFEYELDPKTVLKTANISEEQLEGWTDEEIKEIFSLTSESIYNYVRIRNLTKAGYSTPIATLLANYSTATANAAIALAKDDKISYDLKIALAFLAH